MRFPTDSYTPASIVITRIVEVIVYAPARRIVTRRAEVTRRAVVSIYAPAVMTH
jgi:hypothetical protein